MSVWTGLVSLSELCRLWLLYSLIQSRSPPLYSTWMSLLSLAHMVIMPMSSPSPPLCCWQSSHRGFGWVSWAWLLMPTPMPCDLCVERIRMWWSLGHAGPPPSVISYPSHMVSGPIPSSFWAGGEVLALNVRTWNIRTHDGTLRHRRLCSEWFETFCLVICVNAREVMWG